MKKIKDFDKQIEDALERTPLPDKFFNKIPKDLRAQAITIRNIESVRVIAAVNQSLEKARKQGISFADWKATADISKFQSEAHAERVFRTHMNTQMNRGTYLRAQEQSAKKPYLIYSAVLDDVTRVTHAAMDGIIRAVDDPFWNGHLPPNGFNCRCVVRQLTKAQAKIRRRVGRNKTNKLLEREGKKKLPSSKSIVTSPKEIKHVRKELGGKPDKGWRSNKRSIKGGIDSYAKQRLKLLPKNVRKDFEKSMKDRENVSKIWFNKNKSKFKKKVK